MLARAWMVDIDRASARVAASSLLGWPTARLSLSNRAFQGLCEMALITRIFSVDDHSRTIVVKSNLPRSKIRGRERRVTPRLPFSCTSPRSFPSGLTTVSRPPFSPRYEVAIACRAVASVREKSAELDLRCHLLVNTRPARRRLRGRKTLLGDFVLLFLSCSRGRATNHSYHSERIS